MKDKKFNFAPNIGWRALAEGEAITRFSDWRSVFEKIRTYFINGLGRQNSPETLSARLALKRKLKGQF